MEKEKQQEQKEKEDKQQQKEKEKEMGINFIPQKDYNSPNQCFCSLNDLELAPTVQGGDFEGEHELEGRQLTEALVMGGDQQPQSEEHIVVIPEQLITDPETAEDSLFSEPMSNYCNYSGLLSFLENFILGPNQRNQIWRLRLLSGISLYIATVVGFLFYPGNQAQASYHYQMVMLITSVGAPIVVAAIGLFVSFWFSSVPNRHTNWITGLSVANFIMLCGLAIFIGCKNGELDTKRSR